MEPFTIAIPQCELDVLDRCLAHARWPDEQDPPWATGASREYLRGLVHYWRTRYDWRTIEPEHPARYQHALVLVSDQDRRYFAAHPDAEEYIRRYRPGEFFPIMPTNVAKVRVQRVMPGVRLRSPIIEGGAR